MRCHTAVTTWAVAWACGCSQAGVIDAGRAGTSADGQASNEANEEAGTSTDDPTPGESAGTSEEQDRGCGDWQAVHPNWLWCDDFETSQDLSGVYDDSDVGARSGMTVSRDDAFSGERSLRQRYELGQVDAGWISRWFADANGGEHGRAHDEIYVRWYHKFEDGFQGVPPKMARLRSLGPGFEKRFTVHYWIDSNSDNREIVADVQVPFSTQASRNGWWPIQRSDFHYADPANVGRWVCHEMYVKNNTPGMTDGVVRFWADGQLLIERTEADLRGATQFNFNEAVLDGYWNGGAPAAQSRYFDDFVLSTARIGCEE